MGPGEPQWSPTRVDRFAGASTSRAALPTYEKYTVTTNTVQRPTTLYRLVRCAGTTLRPGQPQNGRYHFYFPFQYHFAAPLVFCRYIFISPLHYYIAVTLLYRRYIIFLPFQL